MKLCEGIDCYVACVNVLLCVIHKEASRDDRFCIKGFKF